MKKRIVYIIAVLILITCGCQDIRNVTIETTAPLTPTQATSQTETTTEASTPNVTETVTEAETEPVETNTEDDWMLFVVNNDNPLPDGYVPTTKVVQDTFELDVRCADYAIAMIEAAEADGIYLNVSSAYRSVQKQQENIDFYIEWYMSEGMTYDEAVYNTYLMVAVPGCSEHNAGIAMDIISLDYMEWHQELETDFDQLPEFDWLQENSWKYGFIMSYPKGKEDVTGFPYEPWHYRYVGITHAKIIHERGITFNEYLAEM